MVKISYSKKVSVEDLTRLLRELISVAEKKNTSITVEGIPVPLSLNKILELELELEIGEEESELELSLTWSKSEGVETSKEMAEAIERFEESPHVEVEAPTLKVSENIGKIPEPVLEEKDIAGERIGLEEKEDLDVEKKLEEVISTLTSESISETGREEDIDFKPQGNLLKISEEQASASELKFEIPEYKPVEESTSTLELEKPEREIEKTEVEVKEDNSTEELERILKALKESRLTGEEGREQ